MTRATSPFLQRCYGASRVCRIWGVSRATLYRQRQADGAANEARPRGGAVRWGPAAMPICWRRSRPCSRPRPSMARAIARFGPGCASRASARRRAGFDGSLRSTACSRRTGRRRGLRIRMTAPSSPRVDQVWGTDMTQTVTTAEGRAYVFLAVDHCSGEFVGTHASSSANRWEAIEPIRQGVARHFGGVEAKTALGLILRHDHGSNYMAEDFQREIRFLGIASSPSFVRQPEGNGVAERAIRTLKEQLLWVRPFATVEDLRLALAEFATLYNATWLRARHGHRTPNQIRAEQLGLAPEAATGLKLAA